MLKMIAVSPLAFALCAGTAWAQTAPSPTAPVAAAAAWQKLATESYRGKQDDIFFVTPDLGWYVNGSGKIYRTKDGGITWEKQLDKPGTYFRCVAFLDANHGFAGNIGTDYFPGVTDTTPLYETKNAGATWQPVTTITGAPVKGLCALFVLRQPFINAGVLDYKTVLFAGGRVGSPAVFLRSDDAGASWTATDMSEHCAMILDVHFRNSREGIICAGSDADVQASNALILRTVDGGKTWQKVYQSDRPYELTWKAAFPTNKVGYVTVQSYNPDKTVSKRYVAKTTDGGATWQEQLLADDPACNEFGVGFTDAETGWVGGTQSGYETHDGGATWGKVSMGQAVNKIRLLHTPDGVVGYAIGVSVYKFDARRPVTPANPVSP